MLNTRIKVSARYVSISTVNTWWSFVFLFVCLKLAQNLNAAASAKFRLISINKSLAFACMIQTKRKLMWRTFVASPDKKNVLSENSQKGSIIWAEETWRAKIKRLTRGENVLCRLHEVKVKFIAWRWLDAATAASGGPIYWLTGIRGEGWLIGQW